jgi:hypothetical protein
MGLLSKKRLENIREFWNTNYKGQDLVPSLLSHIDALEQQLKDGEIKVRVGAIEATIDAGPDEKFGTKDDEVKLKRAPRKRKPAAKKKPSAKKK